MSLGIDAASTPLSNWYQVAVVVFSQPIETEEDLTNQPELPWPEKWVDPEPLPPEQSGLSLAYDRLRLSQAYHPVLHMAWTQPARPNRINEAYHVGNADSPVEGFVRLQRGQYLHVIVDMEYRAPDGLIHRLREKRRVKFDEIHYLDHPAFGVLIRVSPAEPPAESDSPRP